MTNALTTFDFNQNSIRVVTIEGAPWFVAADVCRVLGLTNTSVSTQPLSADEKHKADLGLPGRSPLIVSESGLYKLVMRSDKREAKAFQDWLTRDVLPAIRKDGMYVMGEDHERTRNHQPRSHRQRQPSVRQ
ncbi:Bro-N domain-containing protein [Thalassospira sp. ER-Se-21-Dark]|uniref:BRO-N domain-containing protein n=1 Tax=Thalassospira sp. ER-Se-21-Dark TaxID=2585190 RepID=UPI001B309F80|nr:Bro-N domain-containing protein [Thalassospira sp. ER-Se-21-Dark]